MEINNSWIFFSDKYIAVINLQADMKITDMLQKNSRKKNILCVCVRGRVHSQFLTVSKRLYGIKHYKKGFTQGEENCFKTSIGQE